MRHHGTYGVSLRKPAFCHTLYSYVLCTSHDEHRYLPKLTRSAFSVRYELKLCVLRTNASLKTLATKMEN